MKDFNSNCINSENAFSNAYNRQFGGEIFFLLSAFQEGCGQLLVRVLRGISLGKCLC